MWVRFVTLFQFVFSGFSRNKDIRWSRYPSVLTSEYHSVEIEIHIGNPYVSGGDMDAAVEKLRLPNGVILVLNQYVLTNFRGLGSSVRPNSRK